jgi:hypothetical protein
MATAHLRKAFRYVNDDDDDEPVEGIDEEGRHFPSHPAHESFSLHTQLTQEFYRTGEDNKLHT